MLARVCGSKKRGWRAPFQKKPSFFGERMSSPPAPLSFYCRGSAYQMAALRESGLHTACDIIRVVRTDVESVGHIRNPPRPHTVYKKHVIGFLKQRCNAVFVDFDRLLDERVLFRGGEYPDQWYSIHRRLLKREEPASPSVAHRVSNGEWTEEEALAEAIRQSAHLHHSCDDLEEAAFNEALKQSVESMPPSPVLKTATAAQGPPLCLSTIPAWMHPTKVVVAFCHGARSEPEDAVATFSPVGTAPPKRRR